VDSLIVLILIMTLPGIIRRLQEAIPGASISDAPAPDITAIV
jgi:hypothetical protein